MSYERLNIQDAQIISESLNDTGSGILNFLARQAENITSKNRGVWVTETLVLADLAKDNDALRTAYGKYKQPIDDYFSQVDVEKAVQAFGRDLGKQINISLGERAKNNLPGLAAGIATGFVIAAIRKRKKK